MSRCLGLGRVAGQCSQISSSASSSFIEPGTFLPVKLLSTFVEGEARSTCRRVSCAVAGRGHPHLPKGQICGINVAEHAVLALFPDEVLQDHYVLAPGNVDLK
jgi:hypothetical protein